MKRQDVPGLVAGWKASRIGPFAPVALPGPKTGGNCTKKGCDRKFVRSFPWGVSGDGQTTGGVRAGPRVKKFHRHQHFGCM